MIFIRAVSPAVDLTGHQFLVSSIRTGDTEIFIADPTTGDLFNVSRSPSSEDRYPCWSPDGKQICFSSDREGTTNLWIADADGTNLRRLNRTPAVCYMPSWQNTPRGELIVFGKHGAKPEMASIKPDGTGEQMLGGGHDPTLSPDGRLITYTGEVAGGVTVFVMNYDGSGRHQVVQEISKVGATFPNWSPDSKQIVYSFPVGESLELFIINADGTNNRRITGSADPPFALPARGHRMAGGFLFGAPTSATGAILSECTRFTLKNRRTNARCGLFGLTAPRRVLSSR